MLRWGVQCENRKKKPPQHKSTYTINTWLATGGTYPALASSRPVQQPFITAPVADLLDRWRYKAFGGSWSGRGVMSVMGEGSKRVFTAALFQGSLSSMTLAKPAGTGEPEKIRLNFVVSFGANSCIPFTALFSLSILVSEIINFHFQSRKFQHDGIHIPVYSLSLIADRSSQGFNPNGQPCETLDSCSRLPNFPITQGKA